MTDLFPLVSPEDLDEVQADAELILGDVWADADRAGDDDYEREPER